MDQLSVTTGASTMRAARILAVDDDPIMRRLLMFVLGRAQADVDVVETGTEALARLDEAAAFDAAVVDLGLPDMAGAELLRQIALRRPEIAIVVASGAAKSSSLRFDAWLEKPFTPRGLVAAVGEALAVHRERARQPRRWTTDPARATFAPTV